MSTTWMRTSSTAALGLSLTLLAGCGAEANETGAASAVDSEAATTASSGPGSTAVAAAPAPAERDPAERLGRRYESGFQILDTEFDLANLNVEEGEAQDGHEGHDHGQPLPERSVPQGCPH